MSTYLHLATIRQGGTAPLINLPANTQYFQQRRVPHITLWKGVYAVIFIGEFDASTQSHHVTIRTIKKLDPRRYDYDDNYDVKLSRQYIGKKVDFDRMDGALYVTAEHQGKLAGGRLGPEQEFRVVADPSRLYPHEKAQLASPASA